MRVKVLARKGRSVLVEWLDEQQCLQRSHVPYDAVVESDGHTDCQLAEVGIPYGVPWELIAQRFPVDGHALQTELRRLGIWTYADLQRNPAAAQAAIRQVTGPTAQRLTVQQLAASTADYLQGATNE